MDTTMLTIKARLRQMTSRCLLGFLGLAMLIFGQAAPATAQVTITQVFVDVPIPNQMTINGQDFDNGPNLVVTLGDFAAPLVDVIPPDANRIVVNLPAGLAAGDYLLTVTTGGGPNRQDDYDLTIGAAVAGVPVGAIILWDQTNACPAGFAGVAAFDDMFLVGGAVAGTMGGANQHAHGAGTLTGPAHRHTLETWDRTVAPVDDNSGGTDFNIRTSEAGGGAMAGNTGLANNLPPFRTILLCRRT